MKNYYFLITLCFLLSCKKETINSKDARPEIVQSKVQLGKELFEGKGNCAACHQMNEKTIGPSIKTIAKIYKSNNGNLIDFLKYDAEPIVDPGQYQIMQTNFSITKAMTDKELQAIEAYLYAK